VPLVACGKGSGENKTEIKLTKIKKIKICKEGNARYKNYLRLGLNSRLLFVSAAIFDVAAFIN